MKMRGTIATGLTWGLWPIAAVGGGMALALMHAVAALLLAPWGRIASGARANATWLAPFALFIAWAGLSQLWSLYPNTPQTLKFAGGVLSFVGLCAGLRQAPADVARRFLWAALVAVAVATAASLFEAYGDMALNRYFQPTAPDTGLERNPGKGVAVLMVTGPALVIWLAFAPGAATPRRVAAGALAIGLAIASRQFNMDANVVALAAGCAAALAASFLPRLTITAIGFWAAFYLIAAPLIYTQAVSVLRPVSMPESWAMRLEIWTNITTAIGQKPWFGWGMDSTRDLGQTLGPGVFIPLHAHSSSLQVWVELGLVGAAILAVGLGYGAWRLGRALANDRFAAAVCAAVMGAAWLSWQLSFSLWQEWYVGAVGIAAGVVAAITNQQDTKKAYLNR
jgi:O-antigen ligase